MIPPNDNGQDYRQPPHDEAAEQCLLACFQWDDSLFDSVPLRTEHFYHSHNQTIFRLMTELHNRGIPSDVVTVGRELQSRNLLEDVGGAAYLEECLNITPHTVHVEHYAAKVKEMARLRKLSSQCTSIANACYSGGVVWNELTDGLGDLRDLIDDCDSTDLKPVSIGEFIDAHPKLKPPVIDGLIRQGEVANIIANPKVGKSWLSYDLALSIATGRNWLGTFQTSPGRVLIIDNELHPESIAGRIPTVADALSIDADDYRNRLDVISLRGRLVDFYGIGSFVRRIKKGEYTAIIVDAYYRMLPKGVSENDNAQIAGVYNTIDNYAARTNAAWFLIHHSTKGSQSDKRATDVGAGAGSQSRAADCHLVLREHEEAGIVVLDAAVRSFPPVDPVVLQWTFPIWQPVNHLDPGMLKGRLTKNQVRQQEDDTAGGREIVSVLLNWNTNEDREATPNRIAAKSPFGRTRTHNLLAKLLHSGDITREPFHNRGNPTHVYSLPE